MEVLAIFFSKHKLHKIIDRFKSLLQQSAFYLILPHMHSFPYVKEFNQRKLAF